MLDVRRLRVLREVAARGSIAAAADALAFTPSALSQQLSKLEREAGVALLERGPRSVTLTPAGRALAARAGEILERLADAEAELDAYRPGGSGAVRLAAFPSAAATIVPPALSPPGVDVRLTELDPVAAVEGVAARELDVALTWEYDGVPAPVPPGVERVALLDDPVHVIIARSHPLAARAVLRVADLAEESWITSTARSSCQPFTGRVCAAAGFEPRVSAETDDHRVLGSLVAAGVGVALESDLSLSDLHPGIVVRPLEPPAPKRTIFAAFRAADRSREGVRAVVDLLRAEGERRRPRFAARSAA
jgi:DNA-binding transcriptional LysR family regulator